MQQYLVDVQLGGKPGHIQSKKTVTIPEIAVLKVIHGEGSVQVVGKVKDPATTRVPEGKPRVRTMAEERERLRQTYPTDIDAIFGGPMAALPTSLRQIGVDPDAAAARLREQAAQAAAAAAAIEDEVTGEADGADEASIFDDEED